MRYAVSYVKCGKEPEEWMGVMEGADMVAVMKEALILTNKETEESMAHLEKDEDMWIFATEKGFHLQACVVPDAP